MQKLSLFQSGGKFQWYEIEGMFLSVFASRLLMINKCDQEVYFKGEI